jgi:ABC-type multidrug transport system ATPase subunit
MVRALRLVGLESRRHEPVSANSGGMARRLEIARGLLHTLAVLFLDCAFAVVFPGLAVSGSGRPD